MWTHSRNMFTRTFAAWFTPDLSAILNRTKRSGFRKSQGLSALPLGLMWAKTLATPTPFRLAKFPLQTTVHSIIDAPGRVVIHVRIPPLLINPRIYLMHSHRPPAR